MKALIVHLSDIHLQSTGNVVESKIPLIASALQNEELVLDSVLLMVSGDLVYSGAAAEYDVAKQMLESLCAALKQRLKIGSIRVALVPGNHDCDLPEEDPVRAAVIDKVRSSKSEDVDIKLVAHCTEAQARFFEFRDGFLNAKPDFTEGQLYWEYHLPIQSAVVLVRCYNTAWQSTRREQQGSLHFPANALRDLAPSIKSDYTISVFHHPYNWMPAQTYRTFRAHVERSSDLILTGHEHEPDHYQKYSFAGEVNEYLEGAVLQEHGREDRAGFHAIFLDLNAQQQRVQTYSWNEKLFLPGTQKDWAPYSRGSRGGTRSFQLAPDFAKWLDDPGASFSHPAKPDLSLIDIYVFPNVKEFQLNRRSEFVYGSLIEGRDLLKLLGSKDRVLLFGRQQAGKTTLIKILFRDLYYKGLTPVLLAGDDLSQEHLDKQKFDRLVEAQLRRQFDNPLLPAFSQLDREKSIVMIDDFDHAHLNARGRLKLLENLTHRFEKIYVFGDDVLKLEEIATGQAGETVFSTFTQFEIVQFGHLLRNKLIEKWYSLGGEYVADPQAIGKRVAEVERVVTALLGKNYLPSYPIYVLSFIQAYESSNISRTTAGTYGSLYEVLITQALAVKSPSFSLDVKNAYLSELANFLFTQSLRRFSETDWIRFHAEYCAKYKISPSRGEMKRELGRAGIVTLYDEKFGFQHPASYYYFVARYIRDNITQPAIRELITTLCSKVNKEENASILLFLTHLSKDPYIIDVILKHAQTLFTQFKPARFEDDIQFIQNFTDQIEQVCLVDGDFQTQRESRLRQLDEAPEMPEDSPDWSDETDETLRLIAQMTMALRTLEVLGQLIKNFPGSLVGTDKFALVKECYELGLRTVSMLFSVFDTKIDDFVDLVANRVIENRPNLKDSEEFKKRVRSFMLWMIEATCFGMIKRISLAVGHPQLTETYADVKKDLGSSAASLIDIAINLEHVGFPEDQLQELSKRFPTDTFCGRILRQLVVEHFYLFPTKESTKQKVCTALEIKIQSLRQIDVNSKHQRQVPGKPGATSDKLKALSPDS